MARLILLDDERRTYPPASAHRMRHDVHNPNLISLAVWSVVIGSGVAFVFFLLRMAFVFYQVVTLQWWR